MEAGNTNGGQDDEKDGGDGLSVGGSTYSVQEIPS